MTEITNKPYDLEERTLGFAKAIIHLCKKSPKTTVMVELVKQLIRSGASIGANYREANEALGRKDFTHRLSITRKEAKETSYWLELIQEAEPDCEAEIKPLLQEVKELRSIFTAIINKSK